MQNIDFSVVTKFENKIAEFFGAPYAIAVDSCTHGIELCLRYTNAYMIYCPKKTYLSIPMLAKKLNIEILWEDINWKNYYYLTNNVIDAAVLWKQNSYISRTFMNISFQYQKHLNLAKGGMILTDNKEAAVKLKKMSYDGRIPGIPWREQNIDTVGYHYYLSPESAQLGLEKLEDAISRESRKWSHLDYPDLTQMSVFKNF